MTCADCRELLLDLIYGELPAEKAAALELHLAGCAECREERAKLEGTRAAFAPLLSPAIPGALEEPSARFDEALLAAARAQIPAAAAPKLALLEGGGQASAPAPAISSGPARKKGPRWRMAALVGSVAAAAALALVVSTHQTDRVTGERPKLALEEEQARDAALDARKRASAAQAQTPGASEKPADPLAAQAEAPPPLAPPPAPARQEPIKAPVLEREVAAKKKAARDEGAEGGRIAGEGSAGMSKGDAPALQENGLAVIGGSASAGGLATNSGRGAGAGSAKAAASKEEADSAPAADVSLDQSKDKKAEAKPREQPPAAVLRFAPPPPAKSAAPAPSAALAPSILAAPVPLSPPPPAAAPHSTSRKSQRATAMDEPASVTIASEEASSSRPQGRYYSPAEKEERSAGAFLGAGKSELAAAHFASAGRLRLSEGNPAAGASDLLQALKLRVSLDQLDQAHALRDELARISPAQPGPLEEADRLLPSSAPPPPSAAAPPP